MSEKITVTLDLDTETGRASFEVETPEMMIANKSQVSHVLRQIATNLPDSIPGEQPEIALTFPRTVMAALAFTTDAEGNLTLALHENPSSERRIAFSEIADALQMFTDQVRQHA